jgi:hypothetical protein
MFKIKLLALTLALSTMSILSHAGSAHWCTGTIEHTYLDKTGGLFIAATFLQNHTKICDLNGMWKDVDAEICKGWMSQVLAAKLSKTTVTMFYPDITACNEIPTYGNAPSPSYVMLTNPK